MNIASIQTIKMPSEWAKSIIGAQNKEQNKVTCAISLFFCKSKSDYEIRLSSMHVSHTHTHTHTIHTQTYAYKQWERTLAMQFHLFIYFFQLRCSYSLKYRMQVTPCNFYNHDSSANINICIYFFISWFFLYNKKILIICCGGSKSIKKTLSNINI